jgi:hydrogenase nickel incorporation protein HypA/HybF
VHELALIQGVLDSVAKAAQKNDIERISKIKLVVGQMTAALPHALRFCFEVEKEGNPLLEGAELEIAEEEIVARCMDCGREFHVVELIFRCPDCHSGGVTVIKGRELYIDYIEGE